MKKQMAFLLSVCLVLINLLPLTAFAADNTSPPERPYEKVVAKTGKWYAEQLSYEGNPNLVIGYTGSREIGSAQPMELKIKENIVLTGIYVPVAGIGEGEATLSLMDSKGNLYSGFSVNKQITKSDATLIFTPKGDMTLPKDTYTVRIEGVTGLTGAYLLKGIHAGAYEKYKGELLAWELENNPEINQEGAEEQIIGDQTLGEDADTEYEYGVSVASDPPIFGFDADYQVDEIIVSTYNDGQGALPGTISLIGEDGLNYYSGQAYGAVLENVPNAAWKISPGIILPAGKYMIVLSQPEVVSYDQNGEPLFYVKASIPISLRPDLTGTYRINLDAFKTSTLMGEVSGQASSFSLQDFELTVLDKDGELELIGQYEGMPFSQRCEIVEETPDKIVGKFALAADLTKLPYKAKISADALVTFTIAENGTVQIGIEGEGIYDRAASADKGADYNTYDIKANGVMTQRELSPFVMTALGKVGGAGSIPGPDNAAQAAAGILFPPLVGLIVNVLQEALKPKVPAKSAQRDKAWYQKKYPGKTDEQLAMIMLADAMGNTDNPDEGDVVSVGDNEQSERTVSETSGGGILDGDSEVETEYEPEDEPDRKPEETSQESDNEPDQEAQPESEEKPSTKEPESMVLKTSANGAESLYVKDPITGEWVNAETGGVLDVEKYPEAMEQMQSNKEWSAERETEIESKGGSEHDKTLRENMEKIRQDEQKAAYENTLRKKYGTDDLEEINKIVVERKARAEEWADTWRRNDKVLGAMEVGAVAVGTAADVGIDGLSTIVPGGSGIKAGYKVIKGVAGTMAEAGAKGKDPFTLANLAEGTIKGAADAALDKMPGGDGFAGKALSNLGKGALTMAGEGAGSGMGAALRGEDVGEAIEKGLKDGAYKAAAGFVTDQIGGDLPNPIVSRGSFKAVPNLKNVIVSGAGGTKIVSSIADEYGVKPIVMGD